MIYTNRKKAKDLYSKSNIFNKYRFIIEDNLFLIIEYFLILLDLYYLFSLYDHFFEFIIYSILLVVLNYLFQYYKFRVYKKYEKILYNECDFKKLISHLSFYLNRKGVKRIEYYFIFVDCLFELGEYDIIVEIIENLKSRKNLNENSQIAMYLKLMRYDLIFNDEAKAKSTFSKLCEFQLFNTNSIKDIYHIALHTKYERDIDLASIEFLMKQSINKYFDSYIAYLIGCIYSKLGNIDRASEIYNKILENDKSLICEKWIKEGMSK